MKKGFTLLELLTLIVVLAIIALIVTPFVTRVIKEQEKLIREDFSDTIINLTDEAKQISGGSGGGGSSFISGYTGCNAVNASGDHTNQPNHFSNKVFSEAEIKAGNQTMLTWGETSTMVGNTGNGYAKITYNP